MPDGELARLTAWFRTYVAEFCRRDPRAESVYRMKAEHTGRVRLEMRNLAAEAGLAGPELEAAETAALLHDVGRFEQYERYRTFRDGESEHHGRLALRVIRAHGLLEGRPARERRRILAAVGFHNEPRLRSLPDPAAFLLLRLLRDADKLDILSMATAHMNGGAHGPLADFKLPPEGPCSPAVAAELLAGRVVPIALLGSRCDAVLFFLSWVFDLNFPAACRRVLDAGWFDLLAGAVPEAAGMQEPLGRARARLASGSASTV